MLTEKNVIFTKWTHAMQYQVRVRLNFQEKQTFFIGLRIVGEREIG